MTFFDCRSDGFASISSRSGVDILILVALSFGPDSMALRTGVPNRFLVGFSLRPARISSLKGVCILFLVAFKRNPCLIAFFNGVAIFLFFARSFFPCLISSFKGVAIFGRSVGNTSTISTAGLSSFAGWSSLSLSKRQAVNALQFRLKNDQELTANSPFPKKAFL